MAVRCDRSTQGSTVGNTLQTPIRSSQPGSSNGASQRLQLAHRTPSSAPRRLPSELTDGRTSPISHRDQVSLKMLYEQQAKMMSKMDSVLKGAKTQSGVEHDSIPRELSVCLLFVSECEMILLKLCICLGYRQLFMKATKS